jgi:hypothetical protein
MEVIPSRKAAAAAGLDQEALRAQTLE